MIKLFTQPYASVPTLWIDVETTGIRPGVDRVCQVAVARFEDGVPVGSFASVTNPGAPIPAEATAIHGITDAMAANAPTVADVFALPEVIALADGAQRAAYNASFDKNFVPPFAEDHAWPWLDSLSLVRVVDKWVKGPGRHKLAATCLRHGVELLNAHDARSDATAAGVLFYKLAPQKFGPTATLGEVIRWQRIQESESWFDYNSWLAKQPPREAGAA